LAFGFLIDVAQRHLSQRRGVEVPWVQKFGEVEKNRRDCTLGSQLNLVVAVAAENVLGKRSG